MLNERIQIPETDIFVSSIGLGTALAGVNQTEKESDYIFDLFLELGGNLIDTARIYSDWIPPETGRSERVIGDWLRRSGKRNQVVIATKGGHPKFTGPSDDLHISRMTPDDMRYDVELSLKALGTDTIDLYFYHRDNTAQSVEEEIEIMEDFRREGKLRYYACSNWSAERIREADAYCRKKGYRGFAADEALFNMGSRYMKPLEDDTLTYIKDDLFDYHKENPQNLAMPYMGLANGFFHQYIAGGEEAVKEMPYFTPENLKAARQVRLLMEKYSASVSQVVLGFFRVQDFSCVPLFSTQKAAHLMEAMKTEEIPFRKEDFCF